MCSALLIIFILCVSLILHTYLFFPLLMIAVYRRPARNRIQYAPGDELPQLAVLVAAHNEEEVIGLKLRSVFDSGYPAEKLKVYVGSDASTDRTDQIVTELQQRFRNLQLVRFPGRVGKISIINHLQSLGDEEILVMTDANVIFERDTLYELVKYFRDDRVGIVAGNIVKLGDDRHGIAWQEKTYLSLENKLKAAESNAFGLVMGAEGGCYAIRNNLFSKVPLRFIVDDFFITMQVMLRGFKVLFNLQAVCHEEVPGDSTGEYSRKVRISSGNFQNLFFFRNVLGRVFTPLGLCFWSHKVLRWLTPFLLLMSLATSALLTVCDIAFAWVLILQMAGMLLPLIDRFIHFRGNTLKTISHFYMMNLALFTGFFRFLRGIRSSVWQPVRRNV